MRCLDANVGGVEALHVWPYPALPMPGANL
jgi:hypothetical protein